MYKNVVLVLYVGYSLSKLPPKLSDLHPSFHMNKTFFINTDLSFITFGSNCVGVICFLHVVRMMYIFQSNELYAFFSVLYVFSQYSFSCRLKRGDLTVDRCTLD